MRLRSINRFACAALSLLAGCTRPSLGAHDIPLRVMTYNIQSGHGSLDGTAAAIRAERPDIVALQEVDVHWAARSGFADQAALLGEKLGMQVRFAPIYNLAPDSGGKPMRQFGVAILSRYDVVSFENRVITRLSTQEQNPVPTPMPGLADAVIDVGVTRVRVLNTHLDYRADPRVREMQIADILRYIEGNAMPTILMGDLNAEPDAPELRPLFRRLFYVWETVFGPGYTYPADNPTKRIDYVLASPEIRGRSASVPETQASDHRPVVVDLILTR
ncbi:MAG: endonuclease/exonuclease/phosphatase family protein [Gemmatimonadota bacterium]|nr:endonuclease/exonuclease/phosphatase family protein [Gemmatimonadota bacterium]